MKGLYYRPERKAFSVFKQSPLPAPNASLANTAVAQHETEQAPRGTSGTKHRDSQQSKCRISTTATLAVPSWVTVTAWDDEADSFSQVGLHIPASKWWLLALCSFSNGLYNLAIWLFGIVFNGYWTLFYWSIVNLQCCVSFKYIVKWFIYTYIYIGLAKKFVRIFLYDVLYILIQILFHYGLWQDSGYSSLCYTVGHCCLTILYIVVGICQSQTPNLSFPTPFPFGNRKFVFCLWVYFCFVNKFICIIF